MKYTENLHYLEYMKSYASGNYSAARLSLTQCLKDCREELPRNLDQEADLFRRMGDLFFLEGNKKDALNQYRISEEVDPHSLLNKLLTARFLGEKIGDTKSAEKICDEIIKFARNHPWSGTDYDFASDEYIEKAEELKISLKSK